MVDRSAEELAEAANGNVSKKNLTKDSGMLFTYLYDEPLIEHLNNGEQPEYIFSNGTKGYKITEQNGDERTPHHEGHEGKRYLLVTNQRVLYVAGCKDGDETLEHSYEEIDDIESLDAVNDNIQFYSSNGKRYVFPPSGHMDQTINAAVDYVSERISGTDPESAEENNVNQSESDSTTDDEVTDGTTSKSDFYEKIDGLSNINISDVKNLKNDDVPENITHLDEYIRSDESFHYAYSINSAYRGEDQLGGFTTGGCLLATNSRLTAYINETIGSSNLSIEYDKIDTVEIEHGAMVTKLSVQSTSKTYTFPGFNTIDKSEIHDFADFIRDQASESETQESSGSSLDPTEQLKNIRDLHEQGALTDEEFEEKKQDLLDKL